MPAVSTKPVTIAEFDKLDLPEDRKWELHNGEVVEMSFPHLIHKLLQQRISDLLEEAFPKAAVLEGYPFQIEETNDKRSADVGLTSQERLRSSLETGALIGAPEVVVEVLSPSNSLVKLKQDRRLCFNYGTLVYLIVDSSDNTIEVYLNPDKADSVLQARDNLELSLFGERKTIPVARIFAGITLPEAAER
jgi:Uma2 family endonuclease